MPLLRDARPLIRHAFAHAYLLPAFNVCSLEMARACLEAAELERAPVILQTYPTDLQQAPAPVLFAMVRALAEDARVPVVLHLDHGSGFDMAVACLRAGYGSVMYDGAARPLAEIIETTRRISRVTHAARAALEVAADSFHHGQATPSDPNTARRLLQEGCADMVACSVGSEHGQTAQLDLDRLAEIADAVKGPLVLHGGSGISAEDYDAARHHGVVKANIGSALYRALRQTWAESADAASHREVYQRARAALREVAREKIRIMHASGMATKVRDSLG
ncbi:MAG TPA: class II fructose-bisphosphate aldolase [Trueperaceae bacterium]